MTTVVVLADTHVREGGRSMPAAALPWLERADAILHAGDVVERWLLEDLAALAPVHAVLGNNDHGLDLPTHLGVVIDGVRFGLVHDSGPAAGRSARLARWFPQADVVVFGHSHLPWDETATLPDGRAQRHLNPGSATWKRRAPHHTLLTLTLASGTLTQATLVPLDP